ncbi:hypothetical protein HHK36_003325 [Tetracentron sinense]|uniref:Uncharacterized protein n=1 Tax=Tetracentron sinense TaxID=13715 RepID=A0A835DNJ4_TETSI|nr:hypothetical protein HHK36_003325 [Tetracentron sinense]
MTVKPGGADFREGLDHCAICADRWLTYRIAGPTRGSRLDLNISGRVTSGGGLGLANAVLRVSRQWLAASDVEYLEAYPFLCRLSMPPSHLISIAIHIEPPQRPTTSSLSSTVESFSGPKISPPAIAPVAPRRTPRSPPVLPDDCHSDCDSSSSVIDDGDVASSFRKPFSFDLNLLPLDDVEFVGDDFKITALCL